MFRLSAARIFRPALAASALAVSGTAAYAISTSPHRPGAFKAPVIGELPLQPTFAVAEAAPTEWSEEACRAGKKLPGLHTISAAEVRQRNGKGKDGRIWVGYGEGVYDITEFAPTHPGGDHILLAAGGPLEPYWRLYAQHSAEFVLEVLEELRVGNLQSDEKWNAAVAAQMDGANAADPYAKEPSRDPALIVQSQAPFNAEPRMEQLVQQQTTANELFYVRNHMPVPQIIPEDYQLQVVDTDGTELGTFSLEELKKLPKLEVAATVQCAGNRRNELNAVKKVKGGRWEAGAISNATWAGARLSDVIAHARKMNAGNGVNYDNARPEARHICFEGLDRDAATGTVYAASIPIDIMQRVPDVLLAYEMNGETLPRDHGFPVRAVVPGVVGARCVKWLGRVVLSEEESTSHWQRQDYRSFSPDVDWHNVNFEEAPSIQEMPVISAICKHEMDVTSGEVSLSGYAWSGDGKAIVRVDVSADGGKTWGAAVLRKKNVEKRNQTYDWTLWDAKVKVLGDEKVQLVCKAIDSAYNTQPESVEAIWNLRGLLNNAWHRVDVDTK